jgi:lipopolysaccharide transport protein LptA
MAPCSPRRAPLRLLLPPLALLAGAAAPLTPQKNLPIQVSMRHSTIDYSTQHAILTGDVIITQGDLSIRADRAEAQASGINFQNTRWVFTGNVRMAGQQSMQHGTLNSDRAVIDFRNNQVEHAVVTGNPAQFEQTASTTGMLARGHANTIDYEVPAATMRLTQDAWLTYGPYEITGPVLVYNINEQKLQGESGSDERVHITIIPQGAKPKGKS